MDHALKESQLLRDFPYFIKATGRYKWPAVSKLIDRLPSNFLVAADCRIQKPLSKAPNPILPVALVLFQTNFFRRELSHLYQTMVPAPPLDPKAVHRGRLLRSFVPPAERTGNGTALAVQLRSRWSGCRARRQLHLLQQTPQKPRPGGLAPFFPVTVVVIEPALCRIAYPGGDCRARRGGTGRFCSARQRRPSTVRT